MHFSSIHRALEALTLCFAKLKLYCKNAGSHGKQRLFTGASILSLFEQKTFAWLRQFFFYLGTSKFVFLAGIMYMLPNCWGAHYILISHQLPCRSRSPPECRRSFPHPRPPTHRHHSGARRKGRNSEPTGLPPEKRSSDPWTLLWYAFFCSACTYLVVS